MKLKSILVAAATVLALQTQSAVAESPAELNDLEIAHVAYTADNIDIRYAHLALALLAKLGAQAQDNFLSQSLNAGANDIVDELSQLRGAAFDKRYAENELGYHKAVNDLVENTFIPNIDNAEVKALFEAGLKIFKVHEGHAAKMLAEVQ